MPEVSIELPACIKHDGKGMSSFNRLPFYCPFIVYQSIYSYKAFEKYQECLQCTAKCVFFGLKKKNLKNNHHFMHVLHMHTIFKNEAQASTQPPTPASSGLQLGFCLLPLLHQIGPCLSVHRGAEVLLEGCLNQKTRKVFLHMGLSTI